MKSCNYKQRFCKGCGAPIYEKSAQYCKNCKKSRIRPRYYPVCDTCGIKFETGRSYQRFCSTECRLKSISAVREERECTQCGKIFISTNDRQHFCSRKCQKTFNERRKGYQCPEILRRGNVYATDEAYINRVRLKFSRFEYAGGWENDNAYFFCKDCGSFFKHNTKNTRPSSHKAFTCPKCLKILSDINERERKELNRIKQGQERDEKHRQKMLAMAYAQMSFSVCPICNGIFVSSKKNKKYCSDSCQKASIWKGKEAYRYLIPLEELYERDNGICYLCGGKCDYNDKKVVNGQIVYGNMYPSRDHVYPKSQGGSHTWQNIKLAHRICNSLKGSKLIKTS